MPQDLEKWSAGTGFSGRNKPDLVVAQDRIWWSAQNESRGRIDRITQNEQDRNISRLISLVNRLPVMPVIGHGQALMQPMHAQDVAWAAVKPYLEQGTIRKAYNIGGREPIRYADLLQTIADALGKSVRLVNVPFWMAMGAGYAGQIIPNPLVNVEKIRRLVEDKVYDYSAARDDFGYSPIPFREGVSAEIAEMRSKGLL